MTLIAIKGVVLTMNPNQPIARYVIIDEDSGLITDVINELKYGVSHGVEDYGNNIITPGIIDSHNHLLMTALHMTYFIDLRDVKSIGELIDKVALFGGRIEFPWVLGYGLYEGNLGRLPNRRDLDKAFSERPIFIMHTSGHYAVCNSKALEIAGITKNTPNPSGGVIGREPDGEPNGILYEPAAMDLVRKFIPNFSIDHYKKALLKAQEEYIRAGITTVKDPGGTGSDIDEELRVRALNELDQEGALKIRVKVLIPVFSYEDAKRKVGIARMIRESEHITFLGFKIFMDGSGISRTAWMREPWNKNFKELDDDNRGFPTWDLNELRRTMDYLLSVFPDKMISIHTIGDRAIDEALNIISELRHKYPNAKFTLIHVYSPIDYDLERMKALNVMVETQTPFIHFLKLIISNLGQERSLRFLPVRDYLERGITVCNSSDSDVVNYHPLYGLITSMYRTYLIGRIIEEFGGYSTINLPIMDISLYDAFKLYTYNARFCVDDHTIGMLKPGMKADITVWNSKTLMNCMRDPECMNDLNMVKQSIVATYINGKKMYG